MSVPLTLDNWRDALRAGIAAGAYMMDNTVLAHGCFDNLHLGHIRHLQEARKCGERLVVSVTPDEHVRKGVGRPRYTAAQRVEALKALACVDDAFVNDGPDATSAIERIKPAIYVKGIDYVDAQGNDPALEAELAALESVGGRFHVTTTEKWSSSRLINAQRFSDEVVAYLESARKRGFLDKIKEAFAAADKLKIAFVGETIIDEYVYVNALGSPSKEFVLATVETNREQFEGGLRAAVLHGEWRLRHYVTPGDGIRKTRYIDADFKRKLFEVYSQTRIELSEESSERFRKVLSQSVQESDIVIVMDFGHGLMTPEARSIVEDAKFLAVNAQTNAGNRGFNLITKYRPHLACVDVPEARLATGMQDEPLDAISAWLRDCVSGQSIITHGRNGCYVPQHIPAFSVESVDTMGAGDAFLAVTAPLAATGLDLEMAAFAGNLAGAIKVSIVGHRRHVTRDELMQNIEALLA
jgi:cytidyltransferase-like protein